MLTSLGPKACIGDLCGMPPRCQQHTPPLFGGSPDDLVKPESRKSVL